MKISLVLDDSCMNLSRVMRESFENVCKNIEFNENTYQGENGEAFTETVLRLEHNGPENEPVPNFFYDNADSEILMGCFCPFSGKGMDAFKNLRIVGVARGGYENITVKAATERGIAVFHAPGRNAHAVSDAAIALLLAEVRNVARGHELLRKGIWKHDGYSNEGYECDIQGRTLGLVGLGYVGKLVAKKMQGWDVNIIAYDPYISQDSLKNLNITLVDKETLFKEADFISIHARLTKDSYHLVGKAELDLMKPSAYIINTARSGLLDMEALADSLKSKKIAGAAIDVFDIEPLPEDSPFKTLDNITITPHRAGATVDAGICSPKIVLEGIKDIMEGRVPKNLLNPEVLERSDFKDWLSSFIENNKK